MALFIILLDTFKAVAHRLAHILDLPQDLLRDQRVEFTELFGHKIATWSVRALSCTHCAVLAGRIDYFTRLNDK